MFNLPDYTITETIYEGNDTIVYRGYRTQDKHPFVFKVLEGDCPEPIKVAQFHHEYEITKNLNLPGIIQHYDLKQYHNRWVLILEDIEGSSLKNIIAHGDLGLLEPNQESKSVGIATFLPIAIQVAESLRQLHAHNIIHKDIKPANIIVNLATGQVKLTDFTLASQFSHEQHKVTNLTLEGTLIYMSPEQTGRMNRALDYRTDFYSLGVVFYEMLTGQPPFERLDVMELVHCHLAKNPIAPHQVNANIPEVISHIVMKLLAKTAEERYQSAYGLKADLQTCLHQLQTKGKIEEFTISQQDIADKFQISQKLYGRDAEMATLLQAFERVCQGATEMMLVTGDSGMGKSALVNEIYKSLFTKHGYFIRGQFDQLQLNIPYSAIVTAFADLVRQLLTETETQLLTWRQQLLEALHPNAQIIIDVIPEIELIIGSQPTMPTLGAIEAQNRFNLVFQRFIRVFCQPQHPVIIFLDDLQWADSASLKLMELMMTDEDSQYLFLIGAYRDNEINEAHPLMRMLEALRRENTVINQITLMSLELEHINQLMADILHKKSDTVKPLAELVLQKTEGNPFFVNQFLKTLYAEKLLQFISPLEMDNGYFPISKQSGWQWDIKQIEKLNMTDNVVELMINKLKKLPEETQQALRLAACIGNRFDINTLSLIQEQAVADLFQILVPAIEEGLIQCAGNLPELPIADYTLPITNYQFLHNRVQQVAYALIEDNQKPAIHLQMGQLLLANMSDGERVDKIFEIVDHLNAGYELLTEAHNIIELAQLNLVAGKKAKEEMAYAAALAYLTVGMDCLAENKWNNHYELTLAFYKEKAEVEYLSGYFEQSQILIDVMLAHIQTEWEKADIYNLLIIQHTMLSQHEQAIEAGYQALQLLGIELPRQDFQIALQKELDEANANWGDKEIAALIKKPNMTNPAIQIAVKLLANMAAPAFFSNQALFMVINVKMTNLSLQYGHIAESSFGYACYGMVLVQVLKAYQSAYDFGRLSLELCNKFNDLEQKCKVCLILGNSLEPWVKHVKHAEVVNQEGYQAGLAAGNLQFAGYILFHSLFAKFFQGNQLESFSEEVSQSLQFSHKTRNQLTTDVIQGYQIILWNLQGKTAEKLSFYNDKLSETQYLATCEHHQSMIAICAYKILKSQVLYWYGEFEEAIHYSRAAEQLLSTIFAQIPVAEHNWYSSLILLALYPEATKEKQKQYWEKLEVNQKQMKIWAENCPDNFLHKYLLVEAEKARVSGNVLEAMEGYDCAIKSAKENEFIQDEALANELAARFWLARGQEEFAQLYLKKAHYGYQQWGANSKVQELAKKYPQLLVKSKAVPALTDLGMTISNSLLGTNTHTTVGTISLSVENHLDLMTVMKASQAISSEIIFSELIKKFMPIVIENVGAEQGWLILKNTEEHRRIQAENGEEKLGGEFFIEAYATVENVQVFKPIPLESVENTNNSSVALSKSIVTYVARTQTPLVLNDASQHNLFSNDPYILQRQPKSVLCMPIIHKLQLIGICYLENNLTTGVFTPERLGVLKLLSTQVAISIENAFFYAQLEQARFAAEQARQVAEQVRQDAETANRAKSTFLANMSHELRTPLNAILGYTDIIHEDAEDLSYNEILPDLEKIQTAGIHLLSIINDILDLSKIEAEKLELNLSEFAVIYLIEEIVTTIELMVEMGGNALSIECADELGMLYADYHKVGQILLNLLNNAAKFTNQGTITLKILKKRLPHYSPLANGNQTGNSDWIFFQIIDTGIGIPPEQINHIFEAFTQADNSSTREYGGTGLGLTICEHFCRAMGGNISVSSELGKGSTFTVQLPARVKQMDNG